METTDNILTIKDFDDEPVLYCTNCLSLRIKSMGGLVDYCDECGYTDIAEANIHEWERLYKKKYGTKFINK